MAYDPTIPAEPIAAASRTSTAAAGRAWSMSVPNL